MNSKHIHYPEATCQLCSIISEISEEVDIGGGIIELWSYCSKCDIETNHQIPYDKQHYPLNDLSEL